MNCSCSAAVIALLFGGMSANVPAQQPEAALDQSLAATAAEAARVLSLNFPGGAATEYISALRTAMPAANIVVLGDLAKVQMSPVQLTAVDVWSALRVLDQLPPTQGDLNIRVRVENVATSQDLPAVFAVTADVKPRTVDRTTMQTTVISMADLFNGDLKASDALTAIEAALTLLGNDAPPAQVKFHEETGLLITRGTVEQIDSIRQVVTQLRERQNAFDIRRQSAEHAQQAEERMHLQAESHRAMTEHKTRAEMLEHELNTLRRHLEEVSSELRQVRGENDALMRSLADMQSKVKDAKP